MAVVARGNGSGNGLTGRWRTTKTVSWYRGPRLQVEVNRLLAEAVESQVGEVTHEAVRSAGRNFLITMLPSNCSGYVSHQHPPRFTFPLTFTVCQAKTRLLQQPFTATYYRGHHTSYLIHASTMTAKYTKESSVEQKRSPDRMQETRKNWLTRRLRRPSTRHGKEDKDEVEMRRHSSLRRPQTAPAETTRRRTAFSATLEPQLSRSLNKPLPLPPRPDSGVIRDVNAWLDASVAKPGPPLMAGIPYWREGAFTGVGISAEVRYAVPIVREPAGERVMMSRSQNIKSYCRNAKRMRVRMPTLLRTKSSRISVIQQKKLNRRAPSMSLLFPPNETPTAPAPTVFNQSISPMHTTSRLTGTTTSSQNEGCLGLSQRHAIDQHSQNAIPAAVAFNEQESHEEQRVNAMSRHATRNANTVRPSTASTYIVREDSMGNFSEAPTYATGPPPPSYRSRGASIVTISSFGCIDGMNSERRRAAIQRSRGVKGRFRRLAQKAHFTKETSMKEKLGRE